MKIVDRFNGKVIAKQDRFEPKTHRPISPQFWVLEDGKPIVEQLTNPEIKPVSTLAEARKLLGKVIADTQDLALKTKGKAAYAKYYQKRSS
jgi:hypothetical protein